jgi:hypothetical protein
MKNLNNQEVNKMMFLKVETLEGKTEYLNAEKIVSINQEKNHVKILMGAGLYWRVKPDSLQWTHHEMVIMEVKKEI